MKTKVLIISFLMVALLAAFTLSSKAQSTSITPKDTTLIADETNLTYLKTGAKIVTYSESVFQAISLKWGEEFKSINIRYKTDRHGKYKEYCIYLRKEIADNIKQWAVKNL